MSLSKEPRIPETSQELVDFYGVLTEFARKMRVYDMLRAGQQKLEVDRELIELELEAVDPDVPIEFQPKELGLVALKRVIIDKKLEELSETQAGSMISGLKKAFDTYYNESVLNKKVRVSSTDPERYRLASSMGSVYKSKTYASKEGRLKELNLDPALGGQIVIGSLRGVTQYSTRFLIDRENDYQPAFNIELI